MNNRQLPYSLRLAGVALAAAAMLSGCMNNEKPLTEQDKPVGEGIALDTYLMQGRAQSINGLCPSTPGATSPMLKDGNVEACVSKVGSLYDQCVTETQNHMIDRVLTPRQANAVVTIIKDCMFAHNAGPEQVLAFRQRVKGVIDSNIAKAGGTNAPVAAPTDPAVETMSPDVPPAMPVSEPNSAAPLGEPVIAPVSQ